MKSLILSFFLLSMSGVATPTWASEATSDWVKVFGLTVQEVGDGAVVEGLDRSSYKIEVFAPTNFRSKSYYMVKTFLNQDDSLMPIASMPLETSLERRNYLKLLDLASRQHWEPISYDTDSSCNEASRVVKHVYYLGKTQTILTNCSESFGEIPEVSSGMQVLVKRLESYNE